MKARKRTVGFLIIFLFIFLGISAIGGFQIAHIVSGPDNVKDGYILLKEEPNPDTDIYLTGFWDFYPGQHIVSDGTNGQQSEIQVPNNLQYSSFSNEEKAGEISYKLTVEGATMFDRDGLMLILPDLNANYKVFVNGSERDLRVPSPWGYPVYILADYDETTRLYEISDTIEIVIELSGNRTGITSIPRLVSLKVAMTFFDNTKALVSAFVVILIIVFILLIVFDIASRKSRWIYAVIGLVYTLICLLQLQSYFGYLDKITAAVSLPVLDSVTVALTDIGLLLIYLLCRKSFGKKMQITTVSLIIADAALKILTFYLGLPIIFSWLSVLSFFVVGILFVVSTIKKIPYQGGDYWTSQVSCSALFAVTLFCYISSCIKVSSVFIYLLPAGVLFFLICQLIVYILSERVNAVNLEEKLRLEKDVTKMQTALFSAKMRPHFLYNTLITIQELCYEDPERAANLIVRFSNYLRTNLDFMDLTELIPFTTELDFIHNYIYIQQERFDETLKYHEFVEYEDFKVPPFIVQPLIENAINYGVRQNLSGGNVWLEVSKKNGMIRILVKNEGEKLKEDRLKTNHSIDNIRKRLENLVGGSLTIDYDSEKRVVSVIILIPEERQE